MILPWGVGRWHTEVYLSTPTNHILPRVLYFMSCFSIHGFMETNVHFGEPGIKYLSPREVENNLRVWVNGPKTLTSRWSLQCLLYAGSAKLSAFPSPKSCSTLSVPLLRCQHLKIFTISMFICGVKECKGFLLLQSPRL